MTRKILIPVAVLALAINGVARADVTVGSWFLNQSNTFADGVNYGTVTITADDTTGLVEFVVEAFDVQPLYGTLNNFGIDRFGFNFQNITSTPDLWSTSLPTGWTQDDNGGNQDGFGHFDVTEAGPGNRLVILSFDLTLPTAAEAIVDNFTVLSSGNPGEGNVFFAAHVGGFGTDPGSHWMGGSDVVPVPGAVVLAALGFGVVGFVRRRMH